ncbi:MAG: hypothetical protein AAGL24_04685 [Pseudomonadota bacterium]
MAQPFKAGQTWRMQGRPQDEDARIHVLAVIENGAVGRIYSIALTGVRIRNPGFADGVQSFLPHAPVTHDVLAADAIELVDHDGPTVDHPDFSDAYSEFRALYDKGEAGVFTISLAEILDLIEQAASDHDR